MKPFTVEFLMFLLWIDLPIPEYLADPQTWIYIFAGIGAIRILIHFKTYGVEVGGLLKALLSVAVFLFMALLVYWLFFSESSDF